MVGWSDEQARVILDHPWCVRLQEWQMHTIDNSVRGVDRSWLVALEAVGSVDGATIVTVYHPLVAEEIVRLHNTCLELWGEGSE